MRHCVMGARLSISSCVHVRKHIYTDRERKTDIRWRWGGGKEREDTQRMCVRVCVCVCVCGRDLDNEVAQLARPECDCSRQCGTGHVGFVLVVPELCDLIQLTARAVCVYEGERQRE